MKVNSVERNGNNATVVVEIDKELMETGVNKAYMKARKSIMVPGFRKGKAPRKMIESMYGPHVFYEDGLEEIFPEIYDFAIAHQESFKAVGRPNLTDMQISDDNVVTLTLTTEVYPEVTLGQYKGLEVEKAEVAVSDEQVQAELDRMAQNVASTETVDRAAQMGDTANIDFEGFDNGVPFEGGKGDNFDLKLGSGSFVPGFEEQDVSEFDTLEALKADIHAKALEKAEKNAQTSFENACVEKAAENTTVDIPNALVERELDVQMERFAYQLQMGGYTMEQYAKMMGGDVNTMRNAFRPGAQKQARISVTLEKIAEVENVAVTEEDIAAELESLAKQYELEVEKVKEMVPAEELNESLKTRKAVQIIVDSAVAVAPKAEEKSEE